MQYIQYDRLAGYCQGVDNVPIKLQLLLKSRSSAKILSYGSSKISNRSNTSTETSQNLQQHPTIRLKVPVTTEHCNVAKLTYSFPVERLLQGHNVEEHCYLRLWHVSNFLLAIARQRSPMKFQWNLYTVYRSDVDIRLQHTLACEN